MSVAGAPVVDPVNLASATRRALPRRLLALVADTLVISLLDAILNGTFGITRVASGVATTLGSGGYTSFTTQTTVDWPWLALLWVTYYAVLEGFFGATLGKRLAGLRVFAGRHPDPCHEAASTAGRSIGRNARCPAWGRDLRAAAVGRETPAG